MHNYNYYLDRVNKAIENINYPAQPSKLYEPIKYTMDLGGKRVRPVLTLMTCEAMGGAFVPNSETVDSDWFALVIVASDVS